jgi:hypothetical protein
VAIRDGRPFEYHCSCNRYKAQPAANHGY